MTAAVVAVFVVAYAAIAFENPLKINKAASALCAAGVLWTMRALDGGNADLLNAQLAESLVGTAQIVFFLMGAMTIVEVVDAHNGFEVITSRIRTARLPALAWLIGFVTFFLSAILDNLTTAIVMVSLLQKLLAKRDERLLFAGIVVIAANAGGAWTPIGDVTTTMLWIGGQITSLAIMKGLLLPALVNMLVPLAVVAHSLHGRAVFAPQNATTATALLTRPFERNLMFFLGLGILIAVPVFKTVTQLPPFMGILVGLGVLWIAGDLLHRDKPTEAREPLTLVYALRRIDMPSLNFFIGILLMVAALEHAGLLAALGTWLDASIGRLDLSVLIIGLVSAVVDNVPIVAAAMGMYGLDQYPPDHFLWEFLAYAAGTGGSILIIGSAAGVAAMGIEKIEFFWYVKRIGWLALLGYFAGAAVYMAQYALLR